MKKRVNSNSASPGLSNSHVLQPEKNPSQGSAIQQDLFERLSDEVIFFVLSNLKNTDLGVLGLMNHRFHTLCMDHRLQGNQDLLNQAIQKLSGDSLTAFLQRPISRKILQREVTILNLENKQLTENDLKSILLILDESPSGKLQELHLGKNNISDKIAIAVANTQSLQKTRVLNLEYRVDYSQHITPEGIQALAKSEYLTNLEKINLSGQEVGNEGVIAITKSNNLRKIKHLYLSSDPEGELYIDDEGVEEIVTHFDLEELNLTLHPIGHKGFITIVNSTNMQNLKSLMLEYPDDFPDGIANEYQRINDESVIAMATSAMVTNLKKLQLSNMNITSESMVDLANSANIRDLENLSLSFNDINDEGAIALANSPCMKNLISLELQNNNISAEGALALVESEYLLKLKDLNLCSNPIASENIELIRAAAQRRGLNLKV